MARRRIDTPVESSASKLLQKSDGSYDLTLEIDTATGTIYEGGTAVPSGGGTSEVQKVALTLTAAQLKASPFVPILFLPAQAGKTFLFIQAIAQLKFVAPIYTIADTVNLAINLGLPGGPRDAGVMADEGTSDTGTMMTYGLDFAAPFNYPQKTSGDPTFLVNNPLYLVLQNTFGAPTLGNSPITVTLWYVVIATP